MALPDYEIDGWFAAFRREFVREPAPFLAVNIMDVSKTNLAQFHERRDAMWTYMSRISPVEPVVMASTDHGDHIRMLSVVRYTETVDPDVYYPEVADDPDAQAAFRAFAHTLDSYNWFIVREAS